MQLAIIYILVNFVLGGYMTRAVRCCRYSRNSHDPTTYSCSYPTSYQWCFMCKTEFCKIFAATFGQYELRGVNYTGEAKKWPVPGCSSYNRAIVLGMPLIEGDICYCDHMDYCNRDFLPEIVRKEALHEATSFQSQGYDGFNYDQLPEYPSGEGYHPYPIITHGHVLSSDRQTNGQSPDRRRNGAEGKAPVIKIKNETRMMVFFVVWGMAAIFASLCCVVCQQTACCCTNL